LGIRRGATYTNGTVIELLSQSLGVGATRSNGLGRLAGTWTEEEFQEFERAVAPPHFDRIGRVGSLILEES